jgi:hypothetical protein
MTRPKKSPTFPSTNNAEKLEDLPAFKVYGTPSQHVDSQNMCDDCPGLAGMPKDNFKEHGDSAVPWGIDNPPRNADNAARLAISTSFLLREDCRPPGYDTAVAANRMLVRVPLSRVPEVADDMIDDVNRQLTGCTGPQEPGLVPTNVEGCIGAWTCGVTGIRISAIEIPYDPDQQAK